jgi:hypothetical protein
LHHLHPYHVGHNFVVELSFDLKGATEHMETSDHSTIAGVFREQAQADLAVEQLKQAGFNEDQIQVTVYNPTPDTSTAEEEVEGMPQVVGTGGGSRFVLAVNAEGREHEALGVMVNNGANNSDIPHGMALEHGTLVSEQGENTALAPEQGVDAAADSTTFFGKTKDSGQEGDIKVDRPNLPRG